MADRSVARRYAKALIDLATEYRGIEKVHQDLRNVLALVEANNAQLLNALSNPVFTVAERRSVLSELLPRTGASGLTRNTLMVLLEKGRFNDLPAIAEVYADMADGLFNRTRVVVETAEAMGPQLEAEVRAALSRVTGKEVVIQSVIKPELIGGMVARVGSRVYDASVRSQLEGLRQKLLQAQIPAEA
jgi:F-type H+-transporting ATPase subunit delta